MFGIAAFAQTPFASLAGAAYAFAVTENLTSADSSTQLSAFLQSIAENIRSEDDNSNAGLFFGIPPCRHLLSIVVDLVGPFHVIEGDVSTESLDHGQ